MDQLFFTISFIYEILPTSLQVHLCAEIELIDKTTCIVRNIRRIDIDESPLLPLLHLKKNDSTWLHNDSNKESNISQAIGAAVDKYLKQLSKSPDERKDN